MAIGEAYVTFGAVLTLQRPMPRQSLHAHRPFELLATLEGSFTFIEANGHSSRVVARIVAPYEKHAIVDCDGRLARLYVDPGARRMGSSASKPAQPRPAATARIRELLAEFEAGSRSLQEARPLMETWQFDWLDCLREAEPCDERVARALALLDDQQVPQTDREAVASLVGLSSSRFAALFAKETGVPLARYMRWRRILFAARLIRQGETITAAAVASGFSDNAHLTRVYRQTFGTAPSTLQTIHVGQPLSDVRKRRAPRVRPAPS